MLCRIQADPSNTVRIIPLDEILYFRASDKCTSVAMRGDAGRLAPRPRNGNETLTVSRGYAELYWQM